MIWLSTSGIVVALAVIMLLWVVPRASRRAPANGSRRQLASVGRTAEDIFAIARAVRAGVAEKFGVELVPEPVVVNGKI